MKLLKAIVRPDKIEDVRNAVNGAGISGLTVTEVRGHGQQKGHTAIYRGQEYEVTLLPKFEVEVVVPDSQAVTVTEAVMREARTGQIGDGRVFVLPVEESYKIRTGEREVE
jgi:nitrogen regulatory protein P-II 2